MDLDDIRTKRHCLAADIRELIVEFENETTIGVREIEIERMHHRRMDGILEMHTIVKVMLDDI